MGDHGWISATDFSAAQTSSEWDMLLTRGSGLPVKDLARDSLFVKFDPLVQKQIETEMCTSSTEEKDTEEDVEAITPTAPSEWDMLLTRGSGLPSGLKDLTRDSLFVKFDPLVQKRTEICTSKTAEKGTEDVQAITFIAPLVPKRTEICTSKTAEKETEDAETITLTAPNNEFQTIHELLENTMKANEDIRNETSLVKEDLNEIESSFAEVLLCYESGKIYQKNFEHNERALRARILQLENSLVRRDEKYQYIETKANDMTEKMKQDQEARLKVLNNENFKLKASLKMSELKVQKLENEIEHITTSSGNLQKLCDEMIQQC